jgi:hypothetical protein
MTRFNIIACALLFGSCAQELTQFDLDPTRDNGRVLAVRVYPNDLLSDPTRYVMCFSPCAGALGNDVLSVLYPNQPGVFNGFDGEKGVNLRVRFNGVCFNSNRVCPEAHRPLIFEQIE